jgi:hypothetical protein
MIRILISILLLMLSLAPAGAAGLALRAAADKQQITIGDRLVLTLTCTVPAGGRISEPAKTPELGPWTVKDIRTEHPDSTTTRIIYTLTTFTTGQVTIPPIAVTYTDAAAAENRTLSEPLSITVASVLPAAGAMDDIRDIKPPLPLPVPPWVYLTWGAAIAAACAGFWIWYRRYRQRQDAGLPVPAVPAVPPYQAAMDALARLRASGLIADGKIKEFYIALSDIIRDYLAAVYGIELRDKTSAELYAALKGREPDRMVLGTVKDFFDGCDLVKFAKYRPEAAVCDRDWDAARKIVEG